MNDINIVKQYPTKKGWHMVTEPFNPQLLTDAGFTKDVEIKKDGLLSLAH